MLTNRKLHSRYTYTGPLGDNKRSLALWAPTAQRVVLLVFDSAVSKGSAEVKMKRDGKGVWSCVRQEDWNRKYYLYRCAENHPLHVLARIQEL
jgi:1,4-alpha-glucan branching enzyme